MLFIVVDEAISVRIESTDKEVSMIPVHKTDEVVMLSYRLQGNTLLLAGRYERMARVSFSQRVCGVYCDDCYLLNSTLPWELKQCISSNGFRVSTYSCFLLFQYIGFWKYVDLRVKAN